jgi:hypothetical protein
MPLFVLIFLGLMGWVLMRLIGGPASPETFNPNSCSSCSSKQGGQAEAESTAGKAASEPQPGSTRFPVAPGHHRLNSTR